MRGLSILIAAALLSGCAHWQSGADAPFVRWKCESGQHIAWRYADEQRSAIDLKVGNSEQIHSLRREPAITGTFYSDGAVAFHHKGNKTLVYRTADDRVLAHGCSASLINL